MRNCDTNSKYALRKNVFGRAYLIAGIFLLTCNIIHAQSGWNMSLRPSVNYATQNLATSHLNLGYGFEGMAGYEFNSHFEASGGGSWNMFTASQSFADCKTAFIETGYTMQLQYKHNIGSSKSQYVLKGGAVYNHIRVQNQQGYLVTDSQRRLGWQAEAGVAFQMGQFFQIMPGIRYRQLSNQVEFEKINIPMKLTYVSTGVSLIWSFGKKMNYKSQAMLLNRLRQMHGAS